MMGKNQLKEIIEYERKRWLQLNGLDVGSKVKNRELNFVESLRYVEYYQSFSKWKRLFVGGHSMCTTGSVITTYVPRTMSGLCQIVLERGLLFVIFKT